MERHLKEVRAGGIRRKLVDFTFYPDGSQTTDLTVEAGTLRSPGSLVEKVVPDGSGGFVCWLRDPVYRVASKQVSLQLNASNVDLYPQFGALENEGTVEVLKVTVRLMTAATKTAPPAANANNSVSVCLFVEDSESSAGVP
jgi:hypothetical protein